jgi:malate synthase
VGGLCSSIPKATLGIAPQTIKVTVLIETILAAFEMDEILHELKDHIVGPELRSLGLHLQLHQEIQRRPDFVLPDRQQVTMTTHFLRSYSKLLIKTVHRRGAFAMGGMAPQIPIKNDPKANDEALAKVRADKEREAGDGHDGTLGRAPGPRADRDGSVQPPDADAEPVAEVPGRRARRPRLAADPAGHDHRNGPAHQRQRFDSVHRRMARRSRLRADQQSDGRRRPPPRSRVRRSGSGSSIPRASSTTAAK